MNWQRHHTRDNANCIVSIWDKDKGQWIQKEDTGTESYTEKEKGLASDSFKRACFNWGIGRELYTSPFIWVKAEDCEKLVADGNKYKCNDSFVVSHIAIEGKKIVELEIRNETAKKVCFTWSNKPKGKPKNYSDTGLCEQCGAAIMPYPGSNGKMVSISKHCSASKERFGKILCVDCIERVKNEV